jgi:hypothetical protein
MTDEKNNDNPEDQKEIAHLKSNPLLVAEELANELKNFDVMNNRKEVLDVLRDRFVASTMETASQKQKAEAMVIERLIEKIATEDMNPSMLLRILENVSRSNEMSISTIIGEKGSPQGKGVDVIINNNTQQGATVTGKAERVEEGDEVQHPMKDANTLLEAMNIIAKSVTDKKGLVDKSEDIIDVEPENDDD